MECPSCKKPMKIRFRYANKIVWGCDCGHTEEEETGEVPPRWDSWEEYDED